jgi:hypothetical protein
MLAYFMHFAVPGVRDVVVFRDHADAQQFHILNDRPRIAVDAETGMPLMNYTLFSRSIEIAYASAGENQPVESQLGALNMTVDLSVSDADLARIRAHLTQLLKAEQQRPSAYNTLYKVRTTGTEPRVGYIDWLTGTVRLDMLEGLGTTFKRASSPETAPTLHGTNKATLWATFGSEGAQLMWDSLNPPAGSEGGAGAQDSPVQANITYKLEGLARLPGLRVTVTARGSAVYKELRERTMVFERVGNSRWTYPQISELTKEMVDRRVINIKWDDYGIPASDPAADEIKQQLEQAVMGVVTNNIVGMFFQPFQFKGLTTEDLGQTFTHTTGGKPGSRLWLNEFKESFVQDIAFTLEKTQNFRFPANPQTSLLAGLTDEQRKQLVRVVDVGSPEVRVMTVHVYTNADFQTDRIANITATLSYRQFDTLVNDWIEASESFVFKTGQEVFTFRTRLARDGRGRLVDLYDAKAQINYIGTSQSPPPIELKNISERALTFSYDRLGYVKVEVQGGDIDWTQIKDVFVDLVYPSARSAPDGQGTVHLTEKQLKGAWSTSKHGQSSNTYEYVVRSVYQDGREVTERPRSDDRGTLVIHDTLVGRLRRTFDAVLDPTTVSSVALKVRYEDAPNPPDERRHVFTETGSWEYVQPLRQDAPRSLSYAYDIQYKDGQFESVGWQPIAPEQPLPPLRARRFKVPIMIDGGGLDWTKWRLAVVEVTYRDPKHDYLKIDEIRITDQSRFQTVEALAFAPDARQYEYRAMLVPLGEGEPVEVPPPGADTVKKTGMLLLETLV